MKNTEIYVAGEFMKTGATLEVENPYNGEHLASVCKAGPTELELAISKAEQAKAAMRLLPSFKRSEILLQVRDMLQADREGFAETIAQEAGKPIRNARVEVDRSISIFTIAAEEAKRLPKEYISLDWTPAGTGKEGLVKFFPAGIVAGIAPFNFPLNLAVHKIAPAIAAGCPIILKPSGSTPLSTLKLAQLINTTPLPKGGLSVIPMDRETGNRLVTDERIAVLSFTGSPDVGWKMKDTAGKKKVVLELGGNAGIIVSDSCDLQTALQKSVVSAFSYAGQTCIHAQRIYVQRSIFKTFTDQFIQKVKNLSLGDPLHENTDMSVMIDLSNAVRVEEWIKEAVDQGAVVLAGAERKQNLFYPTVLTQTNNRMKVCKKEIFGPVVTIDPFDDIEEAIARINDSDYGLQVGVFTDRITEMYKAFEEIEVGGVIINDGPSFRVDHMPYGGIKNSGFGREGVKYAILDMMEPKILVR